MLFVYQITNSSNILKDDLNIEAASDKLAQKAKADMEELLAEYPQMNDAERLIFEGNLRRLGNKLGVRSETRIQQQTFLNLEQVKKFLLKE
jgi:hypothetical protein